VKVDDTEKDAKPPLSDVHMMSVSAAVGVIILSVAAAAVIWRVKPE